MVDLDVQGTALGSWAAKKITTHTYKKRKQNKKQTKVAPVEFNASMEERQ